MNSVCQISCCRNEGNKLGITYHKFPKVVAELWFSVNNIPTWSDGNSSEMLVCSDHFKPEDYVDTISGTKLKRGTIPSLYLKIPKMTVPQANHTETVDGISVTSNTVPADQDVNIRIKTETPDELKVLVFPKNEEDSPIVERFIDKDMEFMDIITVSDEKDTCTVINAMHNYNVHMQIEMQSNFNKLLKRQLLARTATQASPTRNRRLKLRNKRRCIELTRQNVIIPRRHRRNINRVPQKIPKDEITENVHLDHDYSSFVENLHVENIDDSTADKDTYDLMCSENYVWRLRKQIDVYAKKTKVLRRRVDALKNIVSFLKNRL